MRKVMLLAAMLAMVLAAAAPAFAQANAVQYDGNDTNDSIVDSAFCNQVQTVIAQQGQYGDANAAATDNSEAAAAAANELGVSQNQVLNCFVGTNNGTNVQGGAINDSVGVGVADVDDDADGVVDEADGTEDEAAVANGDVSASAVADEGSASATAAAGSASAAAAGELPETGGASLLALGAGALLVGGGLVARRIVR